MRGLLSLDVAVVVFFVVLGRETHDEGNAVADIASTAAPFLIALLLGWLVMRVRRAPLDLLRGASVAITTVALGMVLRSTVFDEGTAPAFVIVATVFNVGGMVGWRVVANRIVRYRTAVRAG